MFSGVRRGGLPAYRQIAQILRGRIADSDYPERLPTEDELMREFSVGRHTIRAAIAKLVDDGLLERFPGRGTFVLPVEQRTSLWRIRSLEDILDQQFPEPPKIISAEFRPATDDREAARTLQLGGKESIFCIVAVRTSEGRPYSCSQITLPGDIGGAVSANLSEEVYSTPMIRAVERRCRVQINRAVQSTTAEAASEQIAELLEVKKGTAVLLLARTYFTAEGRPIEYARMYGRPDRYQHTIEFTRHSTGS
jgi:GntR family transcriptional regulator